VLELIRRQQLLGNNPFGAALLAAPVDVQGSDVEAFATLKLVGRELVKCQDTAERSTRTQTALFRALLARVHQEESRLTSRLRQRSQLTSMGVR